MILTIFLGSPFFSLDRDKFLSSKIFVIRKSIIVLLHYKLRL